MVQYSLDTHLSELFLLLDFVIEGPGRFMRGSPLAAGWVPKWENLGRGNPLSQFLTARP